MALVRVGVSLVLVVLVCACGGSPAAPSVPVTTTSTATAGVDISGLSSTTVQWAVPMPPSGVSPSISALTMQLVWFLGYTLDRSQATLPMNPGLQNEITAKILMLSNKNLAVEIVNGRRWYESSTTSVDGRKITIAAIFPMEAMRTEATEVVQWLGPVVPLLERFYNQSHPGSDQLLWYGFGLGSSGGGRTMTAEDRSGYVARNGPTPYEALLGHEVGHIYMPHESLNQFLELYVYNLRRGASADASTWTWTRNWTPNAPANIGVAALLDIYTMIGLDAMQRAYRAIAPMKPAYAAPLAANVIDAFVATVPAAQQAAVRAKLNSVGY